MSRSERLFVVSRKDWSLHHNADADRRRHDEKVKEAIKENLADLISDGSIITSDPKSKRLVKVPIKSLELPRFRYGDNSEGFGTGPGEEGDVVGQGGQPGGKEKGKAGQEAGEEYYETELSLDEIKQMVYEDLGLPYLEPKQASDLVQEKTTFDELHHKPKYQNIDYMRTAIENIKRNAGQTGKAELGPFQESDIVHRTWRVEEEKITNAVIVAIADISGSMGDFERYVTRAFCWWMKDALEYKYPRVELVFIVHDTEAEEVTEEAFFHRGAGGGTMCSSGNELAKDIIFRRFPPVNHNVYVMHFSDGDNYESDNETCVDLVNEMLSAGINQYGYVQIGRSTPSQILEAYEKSIKHDRFHGLVIQEKKDILPSLQEIFKSEKE